MTLKEQAWQSSGLVLLDERAAWNNDDWPPLVGGWRLLHASVVLDHPDKNNDDNKNNKKGQTVVVLGGHQQGQGSVSSVLALNLADPHKQWREGTPMNKERSKHAAVVCNGGGGGGGYVMGGHNAGSIWDCMERMDTNDLLESLSTTSVSKKSHWTTLNCRLSMGRSGCCAVAVHNRYIVVMGGYNGRILSSVDIIDTRNHAVTAGPFMTVPRQFCAIAVIGHRIFVVGGQNGDDDLDSVEYLDYATPCDKNDETRKETDGSTVISFSSTWITHPYLVLSNAPSSCAVVAVGSCLLVAGGPSRTVQVLDAHRNRVWKLPPFGNRRDDLSMVTVANRIALIGGWYNHSCTTLPLVDKNSWCFRRLCELNPNGWYHALKGMGIGDVTSCTISSSIRKQVRTNTCHDGKE